ncbi:olfactory receptor 5P81-like [Pelodytes ibericus]
MCVDNQTQVTEILLLGFKGLYSLNLLLFVLLLLIYIVILGGNGLIILLMTTSDQFKLPMFYFLKHVASTDVLLTTSSVPLMLDVIITEGKTVSFTGCITQLYLTGVSGGVQCYLLAVMSFDRYMAICKPLSYHFIMAPNVCLYLVAGSWFLLFFLISSEIIMVCQFHFCGHSDIDNFFCDFIPLVELSTSDTSILMLIDIFISITIIVVPFVFIIITYTLIFFVIIRIPSVTGRKKFFSTCSSHLASVCTYYITLIIVYMVPTGEGSSSINKFRSLLIVTVSPLMNPFIYSLRNQEIRETFRKVLKSSVPTSKKAQ